MFASLALMLGSTALPAAADAKPAGCGDGYQIGSTRQIVWNDAPIASLKQYYSPACNRNWAYLYMWQSFRAGGYRWTADVFIDVATTAPMYGLRTSSNWVESYSVPAATVHLCTRAAANLDIYSSAGRWLGGTGEWSTAWRPTGCY
jgi:hypothetical protein